ncbi:MAG: response regulator transcription factor [Deltaproteobacteria bacterium]|nr:response regulator transcription factor [Deltaproteobacteria bacterium]
MARILVVDDDAHIREVVQYALEREGFAVAWAADGQAALAAVGQGGVDLAILDVLMPELDGLSVCRRLRASGSLPVILLSSRGEEVDRVAGLDLGADDYVTKPFSPRELVARVRTVLRRSAAQATPSASHTLPEPPPPGRPDLHFGPLRLDGARCEATVAGVPVDLTVTELAVLRAILGRPGLVFTRGQLIDRAWREGHAITERAVDTHVRRIRAKLRPFDIDPIETVHGLGYRAALSARAP